MKRWVVVALLFVLVAVAAVVGLATVAFLHPREFLTIDSGPVRGDALVVLGGGDGRAVRAAELYRQGAAPRVLVTGFGDSKSNVDILEANGVPGTVISVEPSAFSTLENAQFSAPILRQQGAHRVIIVTSWFHSRRALSTFRHIMPDMTFYSRPVYTDYDVESRVPSRYRDHVDAEYLKLVGYWVAHGIRCF
jgi:uncharacterized SAM-binding protein YcdF (DUF218 family)